MEPLLTQAEVMELLGISKDALRHLYRTRRLGCIRVSGRIRFRPQQIEEYLKQNEFPALSQRG